MNGVTETLYQRQGFGQSLGMGEQPALVIVDFVNGFLDPDQFGGGDIPQAAERTVELLALARDLGWPVAHSRIVFAEDGSDGTIFSRKVPSLLALTEHVAASQIIPSLAPRPGELIVRKTLPSAFYGTGLVPWLVQRRVDTVVLAGCVTSGCIRASALDAMNAGFAPFIVADCVADRAREPHLANLFDLAQKCGDVVALDTLKERLSPKLTD